MNRLRHWFLSLCPALVLAASPAHAETAVWSDNFDNNAANNWQFNSGVWKIGSPAAGPPVNPAGFRTHSAADCAYTQNYRANTDARIICINYNGSNTLVVPSIDQQPRLRFWHWFNLVSALGFVEISTNLGSSWTQISPTYQSINGGGIWSRPSIDLSAYAGQSVQFAFRFYGSGTGNGLGWYVDDVEVDTGATALNFPESFEFDPKFSDWSVDFGTWEIGHPTSGPGKAHTGTNCAATVLGGTYGNYVNSRLISPPFMVPSNSPSLRFWQWYSFQNALGFVEINNDTVTSTTTTNSTVTTNFIPAGLNTNIYQLYGAAIAGYTTNFTWNPTTGSWTNGNKALGNVFDTVFGNYFFEAGFAPLVAVNQGNDDYRPNGITPIPLSVNPTNFLVWQGMIWNSRTDGSDNPAGFFGTNYTAVYTTNTSVTTTETTWNQVSPTFQNGGTGGAWIQESLDLTAYAGETVQLAFHFGSGAGSNPGWYVDDLTLLARPTLTVPADQVIYSGDLLVATNSAANSLAPNAHYTFKLLSPPAGLFISNGVVFWQTSPDQPSSTNTINVLVTDNSTPPLSASNSFTVTVVNPFVLTVPPARSIYAGQTLVVTNYAVNNIAGSDTIEFALLSPVLANMDVSDLPVDGVLTWPTTLTQPTGRFTIIIGATDDDPPYYGATNSFTVNISKTPPPILTVPPTQTIYAGQTLTVTNRATSVAFPGGPFNFTLLSDPTGIDESDFPSDGVLTWTSYPTNKSSVKTIKLTVMDIQSGLSATNSFQINISPTPAPTLRVPATQTNYAGMTLTVTNSATNVALSGAVFTFRLLAPSTNVSMTTDGVLTWTNTGVKNGILVWTNNSVSPGTQVITLAADTLGYPPGLVPVSATNHFNIVFVPPHPPSVIVPTNLAVFVGQTLTVTNVATNNYVLLTNVSYTFKGAGTNVQVTSQGVMTWTNTAARPGIYGIFVKVTDNSVPPLSGTNNTSVVTVLPFPSQLTLTNVGIPVPGGHAFAFGISTPWTNTPWRILATTNLAGGTNWLPVYTNQNGPAGALMFTDRLATNFLQRYYRAVFP